MDLFEDLEGHKVRHPEIGPLKGLVAHHRDGGLGSGHGGPRLGLGLSGGEGEGFRTEWSHRGSNQGVVEWKGNVGSVRLRMSES